MRKNIKTELAELAAEAMLDRENDKCSAREGEIMQIDSGSVVNIGGVRVVVHDDIDDFELQQIAAEEVTLWAATGKRLGQLDVRIDGDELVVAANEKSPITRIRRITGYLSKLDNFSSHKQVEAADRVVHGRMGNV